MPFVDLGWKYQEKCFELEDSHQEGHHHVSMHAHPFAFLDWVGGSHPQESHHQSLEVVDHRRIRVVEDHTGHRSVPSEEARRHHHAMDVHHICLYHDVRDHDGGVDLYLSIRFLDRQIDLDKRDDYEMINDMSQKICR